MQAHLYILFHYHTVWLDKTNGTGNCGAEHDDIAAIYSAPTKGNVEQCINTKAHTYGNAAAYKLTGCERPYNFGFVFVNFFRNVCR